MKPQMKFIIFAAIFFAVNLSVHGQGVIWTTWTAASTNAGTASGNIGGINVSYSGEVYNYTTINNQGINYWTPVATFTNSLAPIPPSSSDIITLKGIAGTNTITFSSPVNGLIMDVLSLGSINRTNQPSTYNFSLPFTILSSGGNSWVPSGVGNNGFPCTLSPQSSYILSGIEGSGCIYFSGEITSLSWTVGNGESYSGFTIGALSVPEPGTLALLSLGGLCLLRFRRWK